MTIDTVLEEYPNLKQDRDHYTLGKVSLGMSPLEKDELAEVLSGEYHGIATNCHQGFFLAGFVKDEVYAVMTPSNLYHGRYENPIPTFRVISYNDSIDELALQRVDPTP